MTTLTMQFQRCHFAVTGPDNGAVDRQFQLIRLILPRSR
jgi:hypothetical protein